MKHRFNETTAVRDATRSGTIARADVPRVACVSEADLLHAEMQALSVNQPDWENERAVTGALVALRSGVSRQDVERAFAVDAVDAAWIEYQRSSKQNLERAAG